VANIKASLSNTTTAATFKCYETTTLRAVCINGNQLIVRYSIIYVPTNPNMTWEDESATELESFGSPSFGIMTQVLTGTQFRSPDDYFAIAHIRKAQNNEEDRAIVKASILEKMK
jgi:hypothetical protein